MFYHLAIQLKGQKSQIYLLDQQNIETIKGYVIKYNQGLPFIMEGGYRINPNSTIRFRVLETDDSCVNTANRMRIDCRRETGIPLLMADVHVLDEKRYARDITSSILNDTDSYVRNETLDSGRLISDQIKREAPNNSHTVINGPVIYGNIIDSQVVNSVNPLPPNDIFELLEKIKESIKTESLTDKQNVEASEIVSDIEESVKQQKKPSIIKNALKGLKDLFTEFGANVTAKLIEDKCNGLW